MMHFKDSPVEFYGAATPLDLKALSDEGTFEGYASTFGNKDLVGDIVQKGAFAKSLKRRPARQVKMLWQHDPSQPMGVWTAAKEDEYGLLMQGQLLRNTLKGAEAYEFIKAGVLSLSIGFRPIAWSFDKSGGTRLLDEIDLLEVSAVTFPANPKATVTAVKSDALTERMVERALRDAGFTRTERLKFVAAVKHLLRDAEDEPADEAPRDEEGLADLMRALEQRAASFKP